MVDEYKPAGRYEVKVEAGDWVSGVYFYRIRARDHSNESGKIFVKTRKMLLIK